jgi:hypothetical protein
MKPSGPCAFSFGADMMTTFNSSLVKGESS